MVLCSTQLVSALAYATNINIRTVGDFEKIQLFKSVKLDEYYY